MSKLAVTNFTKRTGSPYQNKQEQIIVHEEVLHKSSFDKQKDKQSELLQRVNKKTAEYQSNKPSSGVFTEVVTHGAFTSKTASKDILKVDTQKTNASKSLLGFPSSANDLALDAKSDLESDPSISKAVKEKVIEKLFGLVSMVQHVYESKVRIMTEFEKFKDTHMKNEIRREKEHSEQLYKLNMNFQSEVVQAIQRLKSELDISRNITKHIGDSSILKDSSVDFNTSDDAQIDKTTSDDDASEQTETHQDLSSNDKAVTN